MPPVFMVVGPPAVGKSSTSRSLAKRFPGGVHVPVDDIREMVVSGLVLPGPEWSDELARQIRLARESVAHMAATYREAGFAVVIDDFWDPNYRADYEALAAQPDTYRVVLYPDQAEAHRRALEREGDTPGRVYIDQGIRQVYGMLSPVIGELAREGWLVVDTTRLTVEEVVTEILRRAA